MKTLIDFISYYVNITGSSTVDTILFLIIASVSFSVAFGIVGIIFDSIGFYDSDLMSDAHWTIRVLIFAGLTWVFIKMFEFVIWLLSFEWWVYLISAIVIISIIILIHFIKYKISKKKSANDDVNKEINTQPKNKIQPQIIKKQNKSITENSRHYCPRCHSKLVKRHGPYGNFNGCEAFGNTGCSYTRKFL